MNARVSNTARVSIPLLLSLLSCCHPVDTSLTSTAAKCGVRGSALVHFSITYPNGGETFHPGDTVAIGICSKDPDLYSVEEASKQLSVDGGKSWISIIYEMKPGADSILWVVPSRIGIEDPASGAVITIPTASDSCLLRVAVYSSAGDPSVDFDISDKPFRIAPPVPRQVTGAIVDGSH